MQDSREPDLVDRGGAGPGYPPVSAVIVTCNEADVIEDCLKSVAGWVDEIVVVDMHSTDGTREIVQRYTDRILDHERLSYVDPARSFALSQATGDWIIMLDPDERIPGVLQAVLKGLSTSDDIDAVLIPFRTWAFGEPLLASGYQWDTHFRFFRRNRVDWPSAIHSGPVFDSQRTMELPRRPELWIEHNTWRSARAVLDMLSRYTPAELQNFRSRGYEYSTADVMRATFGAFKSSFVDGQGYRDGTRGFWIGAVLAMYQLQAHLFLWEGAGFPDELDGRIALWAQRAERFICSLEQLRRSRERWRSRVTRVFRRVPGLRL